MNKLLLAAVAGAALASAPAKATIFNISAADDVGVEVTIGPGLYLLKWIGIADGGLYDSAGGISLCGGCASGFSNAFAARDSAFGSADFEVTFFTTRTVYGTAADSLAAYKAGTPIYSDYVHFLNFNPFSSGSNGLVPPSGIFDPDDDTYRILVLDADGTRTNNTGGISLSLERVGEAVPEPATWAMMLVGFAAIGAAMRRKHKVTLRYA